MTNDFTTVLAERITLARRMRNLTQGDLADRAIVPQSQISKLESKKIADPGVSLVASLCRGLEIPLSVILEGTMDELIGYLQKPVENANDWGGQFFHHPEGVLMGTNAVSKESIIINRFDTEMPNPNMLIFGSSGSGKSYFAKSQIAQLAMTGKPITIIDPQNEYTKLIEQIGGELIVLGDTHHLNPLDFSYGADKDVTAEEVNQKGNILANHIDKVSVLIAMMYECVHQKPMGVYEQTWLQRTLVKVYKDFGYKTNSLQTQHLATHDAMPVLSDLKQLLIRLQRQHPDDQNFQQAVVGLVHALDPYTGMSFLAKFFDWQTDTPLTHSCQVIQLPQVDDANRPLVMTLALMQLEQEIFQYDLGEQKYDEIYVFVDEAQRLMVNKNSASVLENFARTSRKFNCALTILGQDPDRFLLQDNGLSSNPHGRAIVQNCSLRMLLRNEPHAREILQDVFRLSDNEVRAIMNAGQGQFLLFALRGHLWGTIGKTEI